MGICQPPPDAEPTRSTTLTLKISGFGRGMVRPLETAAPGSEGIVRIDARTTAITTSGKAFNLSSPCARIGTEVLNRLLTRDWETPRRDGLYRLRRLRTALGLTGGLGVPL